MSVRREFSVGAIWSRANANRPRRSTGAVVWLMPRAQTAMRRIIKFEAYSSTYPVFHSSCPGSIERILGFLELLVHLLSFAAPALAVALLVTLAAPLVLPRTA